MLQCNRGWGETGDHSHVSHFLIASWQLNNIIYSVVYCLIVRNIAQHIAMKKKHLNDLHFHCTYLSSFRWPFRWCYCSGWVNTVSGLRLCFSIHPCNWEHSKAANSFFWLSMWTCHYNTSGWSSLTCFTSQLELSWCLLQLVMTA